jgi:nickel/cobalt exporter
MLLRRLAPFVLVALALFARPADAHPLGNFTINHLVHVRADAKTLDVRYVGDFAEIPAYAILREIAPSAAPTSAQLDTWEPKQRRSQATCTSLPMGKRLH